MTEEDGRKRPCSGVRCSREKEETLGQAIRLGDQQAIGSEADTSVNWVVIKYRDRIVGQGWGRVGRNGGRDS